MILRETVSYLWASHFSSSLTILTLSVSLDKTEYSDDYLPTKAKKKEKESLISYLIKVYKNKILELYLC